MCLAVAASTLLFSYTNTWSFAHFFLHMAKSISCFNFVVIVVSLWDVLFTRMTAAKAADLEKTKTTATTIIYMIFFRFNFYSIFALFCFFRDITFWLIFIMDLCLAFCCCCCSCYLLHFMYTYIYFLLYFSIKFTVLFNVYFCKKKRTTKATIVWSPIVSNRRKETSCTCFDFVVSLI